MYNIPKDDQSRHQWLPVAPTLGRGDVLLYDSCIVHRGRRNDLNDTRYMMYYTYQRPDTSGLGWVDSLLGDNGQVTSQYYHARRAQLATSNLLKAAQVIKKSDKISHSRYRGGGGFIKGFPNQIQPHCPRTDDVDAILARIGIIEAEPHTLLVAGSAGAVWIVALSFIIPV